MASAKKSASKKKSSGRRKLQTLKGKNLTVTDEQARNVKGGLIGLLGPRQGFTSPGN